MGWTKRQFVVQAFDEIGLASYVFDLTPEQLESALRRLDSMMAMWNAKGIRLGYPLPSSPSSSDLDTPTNVPDSSNEAIYANLAVRLAPSVGKTVAPETKATAKAAYDLLLSLAAVPPEMQLPSSMPAGAGNKPHQLDQPFLSPPTATLDAGGDSVIDFN
jgi:hypothetical protein